MKFSSKKRTVSSNASVALRESRLLPNKRVESNGETKRVVSSYALVSLVVFLLTSSIVYSEPQKDIEEAGKKSKTISLFNGKNLEGWYIFLETRGKNNDPENVFTVQDGLIRISGQKFGCITTNEEYENYSLEIEYMVGKKTYPPRLGKAFDSGVLLHSVGEDGAYDGAWMKSIECQIIDGGTGDLIVVAKAGDENDFAITATVDPKSQKMADPRNDFKADGEEVTIHYGRINRIGRSPEWDDVTGFRGENEIEKPHGQWNTMKCIAKGDTIEVYLNGHFVNRATKVRPRKGRIQIQSEGAEFLFRKIDLTPL